MEQTPQANRVHIAIFGKTNSGKSTLLNTVTGQNVALTSDQKGTTTDPVYKPMEVVNIGPCIWVDTGGIDDDTVLGSQRVERTYQVMDKTDIAILVFRDGVDRIDQEWLAELRRRKTPTILVYNQPADQANSLEANSRSVQEMQARLKDRLIILDAKSGAGLDKLFLALEKTYQDLEEDRSICGSLVQAGDYVLLVMPQDIQAPKGRLILPQAQTIRELLDRKCLVQCVTRENVDLALDQMKTPPQLIITDSQLFGEIAKKKPETSLLTSFSVLFSRYKGDIETFLAGAKVLRQLDCKAKILIAEACSHKPLQEDIGRVKLPRLLKKKLGNDLDLDIVAGSDFPQDLRSYQLIIHCGACMFNRRHVMSRVARAKHQEVPITNYGLAIAALTGILDQVVY